MSIHDPKTLVQLESAMYPVRGYTIQVMYSDIVVGNTCIFVDLEWRRVRAVNKMKQKRK